MTRAKRQGRSGGSKLGSGLTEPLYCTFCGIFLEIAAEAAREHIWKTTCENCDIKATIWFTPPLPLRRERSAKHG
jgi:hypothetical protein